MSTNNAAENTAHNTTQHTSPGKLDAVMILAGGSGTRLWPASIRSRPKQFMDPGTGTSLLAGTVERAAACTDGPILIVTHHSQVDGIRAEARNYGEAAGRVVVLPEPEARNTASAIAFGLAWLKREGVGEQTLNTLVLPADHIVSPLDVYLRDVAAAAELAATGMLVTFGIRPHRPETGYGYIERGDAHAPGFRVEAFREKPDAETAQTYLESGRHFWNSGMFVFPYDLFFDELARSEPDIAATFSAEDLGTTTTEDTGLRVLQPVEDLVRAYSELPKISVDYAVMERSQSVGMVEAHYSWSDVGSWDELADMQQTAPDIAVKSSGCYVNSDIPVAIAGVDDLIVVIRNGRALVTRRRSSQLVKDVVHAASETPELL